ncbi:MAG: hypothetical protein IPN64_12150 [Propionivibrio sp.]|nr:hypothetical protein [Propionivibrio sp.]
MIFAAILNRVCVAKRVLARFIRAMYCDEDIWRAQTLIQVQALRVQSLVHWGVNGAGVVMGTLKDKRYRGVKPAPCGRRQLVLNSASMSVFLFGGTQRGPLALKRPLFRWSVVFARDKASSNQIFSQSVSCEMKLNQTEQSLILNLFKADLLDSNAGLLHKVQSHLLAMSSRHWHRGRPLRCLRSRAE